MCFTVKMRNYFAFRPDPVHDDPVVGKRCRLEDAHEHLHDFISSAAQAGPPPSLGIDDAGFESHFALDHYAFGVFLFAFNIRMGKL